MVEKDYIKLFVDAIKKSDEGMVFDIHIGECDIDEDGIYFEFKYQVDDRIDRRSNNEIKADIQKIIGDSYGVDIDCVDSFINGYSAYKVTIDS